jgi:hypothetical protein
MKILSCCDFLFTTNSFIDLPLYLRNQCCGSGSRIGGSGAFLTPGSGMGMKSGSGIRDEQPGSCPRALNPFFGLKYLNSLMRIRDGNNSDPGSGMEKSRIRDPRWKKVGSGIGLDRVGSLGQRVRILRPGHETGPQIVQ